MLRPRGDFGSDGELVPVARGQRGGGNPGGQREVSVAGESHLGLERAE